MKIIVQRFSISNTSNIPEINRPFLNRLDSEFEIDDAEIIIRSKDKSKPDMIIANDGTLVFVETLNYSRDGTKIITGYVVSGNISTDL